MPKKAKWSDLDWCEAGNKRLGRTEKKIVRGKGKRRANERLRKSRAPPPLSPHQQMDAGGPIIHFLWQCLVRGKPDFENLRISGF